MIYLDNASTTQTDPRVLEAMMPYLTDSYGNAGTLYGLGRKSAEAIAEARQKVAELIGAKPEQIIFTSGGTEANNLVFAGLREHLISTGKTHIITSQIEHDSVINSVKNLCKPQYMTDDLCTKSIFDAEFVPPRKSGSIRPDSIIEAINESERTGLVSVMHTNNETGAINTVKLIGSVCKEHGVLFHTDCVQAASHSVLNVEEIGCDFLSISSHKIHGAKGVGALYVRDKSILSPVIFGGARQEFGLRGGTENVAGIVGFGKACEILYDKFQEGSTGVTKLKFQLIGGILNRLSKAGLGDIAHINGVMNRSATVNMRFDGVDAETLLLMLDANGVCVSAGSACRSHESQPSRVLLAMGVDAEKARNAIRLSVSRMNTSKEMMQAAEIISNCVELLRQSY